MLTPQQISAAVDTLHNAELSAVQVPALTLSYPDMDLADAYAVQQGWVERKLAQGRKVVGYKIGLTSRAMQMAMKIDTPDYGVLLDDMVFANGGTVEVSRFTDLRVEVEFAFVMKRALFGEDVSLEQVLDATEYVVPALELIAARSFRVDPRTGYTRTVVDTIADNAANAGIVVGDVHARARDIDLRWAGAMLFLNGEVEETGLGAGVMNHPARGIQWVCRRFAPHGIGLEPGQVILSGSFTRPVIVRAGDHVRADYGPLGTIDVHFS
ncbi:MAG: 2-oxo-hepta-3-ene-1,7-dioic acid hydratase [Gammaproteobacteria bacterium]|jgi:2-oxo-hept-3-ene-1,7-dioate hydratase|nr:2-oxo-hepta-3-ene-1,7-dioic acid hydratase [Gammaproteobacteria bacterium]MDH5171163.1 2-oxo-hepta-3-ene-1,7-dioic acid hydratase [Gammaproteobacteria bacterium]